ncbi:hypothetical protein L207DRAFT_623286 [Hyaloscypha variabilis F]|uniref:Uncharacterized protein n=1 Tax=Hyaloscypha variabilis (strain UAMH 11265 / GT02V1 / F) TaxID=1149755 RepID=A0A2J6RRK7_HYAVF|nr:hypothetical protein L207DRAFT_623286 [Hyaloscypha variabilis F]
MTDRQALSTLETHGSKFAYCKYYSAKDGHGVPLNQELDVKALSTQRLEHFFANEDFKSSWPASWGQTSILSATKNMQAQIQAYDEAFNGKDKSVRPNRQEDVQNSRKR